MAIRRHRLPRLWLAITLGAVALATGTAYWWERQLPEKLEQAAREGRLDDCLRYGDQLAALRWLPGQTHRKQGTCRRRKASQLWEQQQWREALGLQWQLVHSREGSDEDRRTLSDWQTQLRNRAIRQYQAGDLDGSLAILMALGEDRSRDGSAIGDNLRVIWSRNQLQLQRAEQLSGQQRWWEALDALNRIDHPWWQQRSQELRARVTQSIEGLKGQEEKEHSSHGDLPHTVPMDRLDALVMSRIAAGEDDLTAFEAACRELGGRVVEAGPESACQR